MENDLDSAFSTDHTGKSTPSGRIPNSPTMRRITPLREAQYSLNDEMYHVMQVGNSILKDAGTHIGNRFVISLFTEW